MSLNWGNNLSSLSCPRTQHIPANITIWDVYVGYWEQLLSEVEKGDSDNA